VNLFIMACLFLGSYGIYLGRFLRFNTWDIFADPIGLFIKISERILWPHEHLHTWAFTTLFAFLLGLIYYSVKLLGAVLVPKYARPVT
jgi:uncharacterized membrane protein